MVRVVGIAGPSGAGKTVLARRLMEQVRSASLLMLDWYFKDSEELPANGNFCDPKYLAVDSFVDHLQLLRSGISIRVASMDLTTFRRTGEIIVVEPRDWLIVEGMTLYRLPGVYELCDIRIYLSPGIAAIRRRKFSRDRRVRGRTREGIRSQLSWVEEEYLRDLRSMLPGVHVIDRLRQTEVTREAIAYMTGNLQAEQSAVVGVDDNSLVP